MVFRKPMVGRVLLFTAFCFAVGFGIGYGCAEFFSRNDGPADGTYSITVCETTDIHGAYFSKSYDGRPVRTSLSNVSSFLDELYASGVDPVLIDSGDNLQGDNASYYYNYVETEEEHIFSSMAGYLDYDAIVLGNHDIETGHPVYDRISGKSDIPYLAANAVYDGGDRDGEPYFSPYTVVQRDGVKIAVIGMTNANIKNWLSENIWEGMTFLRVSDVAQSWVDRVIEDEHPQLVILAVHCGTGEEKGSFENEALYLARTLKGIDAVLCGHDHRGNSQVVKGVDGDVLLVDAGTKCSYVGLCEFEIEIRKGEVVSRSSSCRLVEMADYSPDADFDSRFSNQWSDVNSFANREIGRITGDMYFGDALKGPSSYINLIHTVQLEKTGADISFTAPLSNSGKVPEGTVTFQNLVDIYRYENQLFVVELTGSQIKDYLEYSYDHWVRNDGPSYNFDSADGIIYEVSRSASKGKRVIIKRMTDGTPFDYDRTFNVAMTSYRASGGGNIVRYGVGIDPDDLVVVDRYTDIRTLIGDYIKVHGEISPIIPDNWKFVK